MKRLRRLKTDSTKAQIDEVLGGMSATSSVDLNNAVNLDYVQHCITQLSSPNAGSVASCASNATTSGVAQFELGEIAVVAIRLASARHPANCWSSKQRQ